MRRGDTRATQPRVFPALERVPLRRDPHPEETPTPPESVASLARAKLAACITAHAEAKAEADRVEEARSRTYDRLFDVLHPAVRLAKKALADAKQNAPQVLVDSVLGEPDPDIMTVADAEQLVRKAEDDLAAGREARQILSDEATKAAIAAGEAERHVTAAVQAVVQASPARAALLAEYWRCAKRALRCAQALRTSGVGMQGAEGHGLRFVISEAAAAIGEHPFKHDAEWLAALAALREDADVTLPGLPAADADD
jgi:hypothetical protein